MYILAIILILLTVFLTGANVGLTIFKKRYDGLANSFNELVKLNEEQNNKWSNLCKDILSKTYKLLKTLEDGSNNAK